MAEEEGDGRAAHGFGRRGAFTGILWNYGAAAAGKVTFFAATIVLAHELPASDFGIIAFTLAVLGYLEVLTSHGIGESLVYRSDAREPRVANTAFWLTLATSAALVAAIWILAPVIASLGPESDTVVAVVRVLSLELLVTAFGRTQSYLLRHSMQFDRAFMPQFLGGVVKGGVAIALALAGAGIWSFVFAQLAGSAVRSIGYWRAVSWRPSFSFSSSTVPSLVTTGGAFALIAVVANAGRNADYLIVGATLGSTALGYYFLAFRLPELLVLAPFEAVWGVLFPYYARLHDDHDDGGPDGTPLAAGYLDSVRVGSLLAFPLCVAAAALAGPIVLTLYGDAWSASVVPFAFIALWAGVSAVGGMAGVFLKSTGRTGVLTTTATTSTAIRLVLVWLATRWGINGVAAMQLAVQVVWLAAEMLIISRILDIGRLRPLSTLAPAVLVSLPLAAVLVAISRLLPTHQALVVGVLAAAVTYPVLLHLFARDVSRLLLKGMREVAPARHAARFS